MKLIILIILAVPLTSGQRTILHISPTNITLGGDSETTNLTVTCVVSGAGIKSVNLLELAKEVDGSKSKIAVISLVDDKPTIVDSSLRGRTTASGSLKGSQGNLVIHLRNLVCNDRGTYYCTSSYNTDSAQSDEINANVTVVANPEYLRMDSLPDTPEFPVGARVHFTCSGDLGNMFDRTQPSAMFTWETKLPQEPAWSLYANSGNIFYNIPIVSNNNRCQYQWSSVLSHTVLQSDNNRQLRCSVHDGLKYVDFTVHISVTAGSPPNVCLILGLFFGLLEMVVIVVLSLWLHMHRRHCWD